jgi:hypothetical protein
MDLLSCFCRANLRARSHGVITDVSLKAQTSAAAGRAVAAQPPAAPIAGE